MRKIVSFPVYLMEFPQTRINLYIIFLMKRFPLFYGTLIYYIGRELSSKSFQLFGYGCVL